VTAASTPRGHTNVPEFPTVRSLICISARQHSTEDHWARRHRDRRSAAEQLWKARRALQHSFAGADNEQVPHSSHSTHRHSWRR
jgi:hypothetical protein